MENERKKYLQLSVRQVNSITFFFQSLRGEVYLKREKKTLLERGISPQITPARLLEPGQAHPIRKTIQVTTIPFFSN